MKLPLESYLFLHEAYDLCLGDGVSLQISHGRQRSLVKLTVEMLLHFTLSGYKFITKPSRGISENLRLFRATFRRPFPLRQHKNEYIVIQTTATATAPNAVMDKTKLNASHHRIPHATRSMTRIVGLFLGRLGACVLLHSCHVSARYFLSPLQMQACKFGLRLTESDSQ